MDSNVIHGFHRRPYTLERTDPLFYSIQGGETFTPARHKEYAAGSSPNLLGHRVKMANRPIVGQGRQVKGADGKTAFVRDVTEEEAAIVAFLKTLSDGYELP